MPNRIIPKNNPNAGVAPAASALSTGELALNIADAKLFTKLSNGTVVQIAQAGVSSVDGSGGATGLTLTGGPILSSGTLTLGGTLAIGSGGTGQTTRQAALNALSANSLTGTAGQYLRSDGSNVSLSGIVVNDIPTLNQNTTGQAGSVANSLTLINNGTGDASGTTFNGSVARIVSYNSIGAPSTTGTNATGSWNISVTGSAASLVTANNYQVNSLGVGTAASGTAGEVRATGTVIAGFSDARLKTIIGPIENALEKIQKLRAFIYEGNDLAKSLGLPCQRDVGLDAHQVFQVLPEATAPAPIDGQYLTVRYERLVPLLIDAINEQQHFLDKVFKYLYDGRDNVNAS